MPTGLQTCAKVLQMHLSGGGGTPWMQPKSNVTFKLASFKLVQVFWLLILDLNIFIIVATVPTGLQTCAKVLQMHLSGGGGTPWMQPKSNVSFKLVSLQCSSSSWLLILDLNIFIIVATVPTGLQTCAKVLQMHLSGGGGTPWMQPKSNVKFKLAFSLMCSSFWLLILDLTIFIIVATVPTGLQTCAKMLQMHLSGGGGTPWMQPKSNVSFWLLVLDLNSLHLPAIQVGGIPLVT